MFVLLSFTVIEESWGDKLMIRKEGYFALNSSLYVLTRWNSGLGLGLIVQPNDYPLNPFTMKFDPPLLHPNSMCTIFPHSSSHQFCDLRF